MKLFGSLKTLYQDRVAEPAIWLSVLLIILSTGFLVLSFSKLPSEVPLFYSRPWGQEQLVLNWQLVILPFSSLFFLVLDLILAAKLYSQYSLLAQILVWSATIFSLLTTITLIKIIWLIT